MRRYEDMLDHYQLQIRCLIWHIGLSGLFACLTCGSVAAQLQEAVSNSPQRNSPLHDFLGIDPVSGKFVDKPSTADTSSDNPGIEAQDASDTAAQSRAAIQELSEQISSGSLESLSDLVGGGVERGRLAELQQWMIWITAAILLFYPLSMVLAEGYQWSKMRSNDDLVDADRRHLNARFMRRLVQASLLVVLVAALTLASLNNYWWQQPILLSLTLIISGLLCIAVGTLHRLIGQADKDHSLTLIRQVQREQLEMRADVEELRRRWNQVPQNG